MNTENDIDLKLIASSEGPYKLQLQFKGDLGKNYRALDCKISRQSEILEINQTQPIELKIFNLTSTVNKIYDISRQFCKRRKTFLILLKDFCKGIVARSFFFNNLFEHLLYGCNQFIFFL